MCPCASPFGIRMGLMLLDTSRGTGQLGMHACYVCHRVHLRRCKGSLPTAPVGHTCTPSALCSLLCCSVAHSHHLPALLGPASAIKATGPSLASTAAGSCRPRLFAWHVSMKRRVGTCRGRLQYPMSDVCGSPAPGHGLGLPETQTCFLAHLGQQACLPHVDAAPGITPTVTSLPNTRTPNWL